MEFRASYTSKNSQVRNQNRINLDAYSQKLILKRIQMIIEAGYISRNT